MRRFLILLSVLVVADGNTTEDPVTVDTTGGAPVGSATQSPVGHLFPRHRLAGASRPCNKQTSAPCNSTFMERCILVSERAPTCQCMPGFSRSTDGNTCLAVKAYFVTVPVANAFVPELHDSTSTQYREAEYNAREALFQSMMASDLRTIANDVHILGFRRSAGNRMVIEAHLMVSRAYSPRGSVVQEDLVEGMQSIYRSRANRGVFLGSTNIFLASSQANQVSVEDPNPCSNPLLNYCDLDAGVCTRTSRSFVCTCKKGYDDMSINKLEAPGEVCVANCNCKNQGECLVSKEGERSCRCPAWYLGYRCEIDGQVMLIALSVILGALFIAALVTAAICLYRLRGRGHHRSRRFHDSGSMIEEIARSDSDGRSYRMRRPYVESWKYQTYSPNSYYPQMISYWAQPHAAQNYGYNGHMLPRLQPIKGSPGSEIYSRPRYWDHY